MNKTILFYFSSKLSILLHYVYDLNNYQLHLLINEPG